MKTMRNLMYAPTDDYLQLVREFPLRVIVRDEEHRDAVAVLSRLVGRANSPLSDGARQYADALARFIQDYDQRTFPLLSTRRTPLEKLKYIMAESDTKSVDLARILGASQPLTSHILTGKRNLTPRHMRKLGEHFKIAPGYFL